MMDLIGKSEGTDKKGPDGKPIAGTGYSTTYNHGKFNPADKGGRDADLTTMSISEVREFQRGMLANQTDSTKIKSTAVGRYQMMGYTLDDAMKAGVIKADDKFDAATQDRLAAWKMEQRGLGKFQRGQMSQDQVQNNLAKEWASLPKTTGGGAYAGQNAHVTQGEVQAVLQNRQPAASQEARAMPATPPAAAAAAAPGLARARNASASSGEATALATPAAAREQGIVGPQEARTMPPPPAPSPAPPHREPSQADTPTSAATALRTGPTNATADPASRSGLTNTSATVEAMPREMPAPEAPRPKAPETAPATDPVMATVQAVDSTPNYDQFPKPPKADFEPTQTRGAVGGTPLPADERERGMKVPGSPAQQNVALQANLNIAPIRVEHTNGGTGEVIGTEYYPVTKVDGARGLGTVAA